MGMSVKRRQICCRPALNDTISSAGVSGRNYQHPLLTDLPAFVSFLGKELRMRNPRRIFAALIVFALAAFAASPAVFGQEQSMGAMERGYRTGYSDGYQGGYSDSTQH